MITPEKKYPGTTISITGTFQGSDGFNVDPETVKFRLMGPDGTQTSYIYPTNILRGDTGFYSVDVVPNMGGVWHYRWEVADGAYAITPEGDFVVQVSPFIDGRRDVYRV